MPKVDLAKAMQKNVNCLGFIWRYKNGKYGYQNDNDLGLDLTEIKGKQRYIKKIFLGKYYVYQIVGGFESQYGEGSGLKTTLALLKECHSNIELSKQEQRLCKRYWGF